MNEVVISSRKIDYSLLRTEIATATHLTLRRVKVTSELVRILREVLDMGIAEYLCIDVERVMDHIPVEDIIGEECCLHHIHLSFTLSAASERLFKAISKSPIQKLTYEYYSPSKNRRDKEVCGWSNRLRHDRYFPRYSPMDMAGWWRGKSIPWSMCELVIGNLREIEIVLHENQITPEYSHYPLHINIPKLHNSNIEKVVVMREWCHYLGHERSEIETYTNNSNINRHSTLFGLLIGNLD